MRSRVTCLHFDENLLLTGSADAQVEILQPQPPFTSSNFSFFGMMHPPLIQYFSGGKKKKDKKGTSKTTTNKKRKWDEELLEQLNKEYVVVGDEAERVVEGQRDEVITLDDLFEDHQHEKRGSKKNKITLE